MEVNLDENALIAGVIPPQFKGDGGSATGASVDTQRYGQATVILAVGDMLTGSELTVTLQESSDSGVSDTWAAISGAEFVIKEADVPSEELKMWIGQINLDGRERYIRAIASIATEKAYFSVLLALNGQTGSPVTQQQTIEFQV
tara:strand:- start:115 stop:546 length:432 start_codon:yes stop_codon:yes gene_type:complete